MEHRLILGGEIYLPFARSRIEALRATGLAYASQQFEIDGCSVKVRIEPGHEYIWLGGGGEIPLESGIVDLRSISFQNTDPALGYAIPTNIYDPSTLYESDHVRDYQEPFVKGGPPSGFTNPEGAPQFAGRLGGIPGAIKGHVLKGTRDALAFSPGEVPSETTGEPDPNKEDSALAEKKWAARWCPPSMFTGKCRMYAQALMGSPLYGHDKTKPLAHPYLTPDPTVIPQPQWYLPGSGGQGVVIIDTSSGVVLDRVTWTHWLFTLRADKAEIYPLVPSDAGKAARRALKKLEDQTDFDHLETYILSESYPLVKEKQTIGFAPQIAMQGCGYGWHWAWSTATADIVSNSTFEQDSSHSAMESTHHRMVFTPSRKEVDDVITTQWSCASQVVSGPTRWSAHFQAFCIACPIPGSNFMEKILPKFSTLFNSTGTFYVFYQRDTLVPCSFTGDVGESSSQSWAGLFGWTNTWTLGTQDNGSSVDAQGAFFGGRFVVGALGSTLHSKTRHDIWSKQGVSGFNVSGKTEPPFTALLASASPDYGYPTDSGAPSGGHTWAHATFNAPPEGPNLTYKWGGNTQYTYETRNKSHTTSYFARNVAAIPFFDAQAIYLYGSEQTTYSLSHDIWTRYRNGGASNIVSVDGAEFESFLWWQATSTSPPIESGAETPYTEVSKSVSCKLHTSAGNAEATFDDALLWQFWDPESGAVSATLATTSGVSATQPVLVSDGYITPQNAGSYTGGTSALPIIVGWV